MAYRIFTVGFGLPAEEFEYIDFDSDQTLLDAGIILFQPTISPCHADSSYGGRSSLDEYSSFRAKKNLDHWRSEIGAAIQAGKVVIVYLKSPIEAYRKTGETRTSGTGRSARVTNIVTGISSYEAVPNLGKVIPKRGSEIRLTKDASFLRPYWAELSQYSPYETEIDGKFTQILLTSAVGDRVVGASIRSGNGILLFLPPLEIERPEFVKSNGKGGSDWSDRALTFGKQLVSIFVSLADALKASSKVTPTPQWALSADFRLCDEVRLESEITKVTSEIATREEHRAELISELQEAGNLRCLLFEQGGPLESAIVEALTLLGFNAQQFDDGESEFDAVFESAEGRCLGEAEGKDRAAINVDKMSQLERNIGEDFERDEVKSHAKGVLFGNAYRLAPLSERGDCFTTKCVDSARRVGAALVRTSDLFAPAKYLKENPHDTAYAKACRDAIFAARGEVVAFPPTPSPQPLGGRIEVKPSDPVASQSE